MEKLEPALFETSITKLAESDLRKVKKFAQDKIVELGLENQQVIQNDGTCQASRRDFRRQRPSFDLSRQADEAWEIGPAVRPSPGSKASKKTHQPAYHIYITGAPS
ncbi:MAG: hypothetical protein WDN75_10785 [Bacteroidota bacterium]